MRQKQIIEIRVLGKINHPGRSHQSIDLLPPLPRQQIVHRSTQGGVPYRLNSILQFGRKEAHGDSIRNIDPRAKATGQTYPPDLVPPAASFPYQQFQPGADRR